ncbi:PIN/TRAM domain-containing protein [Ferviditalea candida]|uniref:PIN/TRAM domain-containing protein n=1 Tax=Ferviditalea candida TaxID=3108399 RepID=A0ABU5ZMB2_9BACL|nr:PIN/TRAM domain-containing protein [Paenibacillaceae bacterium T2]
MLKRWLQLLLTGIGGWTGYVLNDWLAGSFGHPFGWSPAIREYVMMLLGATLALILSYWFSEWIFMRWTLAEEKLKKMPMAELLAGMLGLLGGLLVSVLLYPPVSRIDGMPSAVPIVIAGLLGFAGFRIGVGKQEELQSWVSGIGSKDKSKGKKISEQHKILDTSVIIDGRIADICKTGFIEGTLVIPEFVLEELQHIADSSDLLKRNRGRRGLDILNKIQKELDVKVLIYEGDFEEITEVDSKLVRLAKALNGKVVTNDFNLNKVCELQGVSVLNINDLANAVKPVVLPGEEILVQVIKDGKEHGQGVAYLDDGTMIVVEGGRDFIGSTIEVLVTSVLQTSAGRMIFAKPKLLEKAL